MARKSKGDTMNKSNEFEATPEFEATADTDLTEFDVDLDSPDEVADEGDLDVEDTDEDTDSEEDEEESDDDSEDEEGSNKKGKGTKHQKVDRSAELVTYLDILGQLTVPQQENPDGTVTLGYDAETGNVSDQALEFIINAYRALSGDRARQKEARDAIGAGLNQSVLDGSVEKARAFLAIDTALKASKPVPASQRVPADPTADFVNRIVATHLASEILRATVPTEVASDWEAKAENLANELVESVREYTAWLATDEDDRGDEPEVSPVVRSAVKMAQGKAPRKPGSGTSTFEGNRGDIMRHITDAFENEPVGTRLTVAQIRQFKSPNSGYDGRDPSAGAISARLNAASWSVEKTGIEPGKAPGQTFGATKVAEPAA